MPGRPRRPTGSRSERPHVEEDGLELIEEDAGDPYGARRGTSAFQWFGRWFFQVRHIHAEAPRTSTKKIAA